MSNQLQLDIQSVLIERCQQLNLVLNDVLRELDIPEDVVGTRLSTAKCWRLSQRLGIRYQELTQGKLVIETVEMIASDAEKAMEALLFQKIRRWKSQQEKLREFLGDARYIEYCANFAEYED
jgi:hypothetical protein